MKFSCYLQCLLVAVVSPVASATAAEDSSALALLQNLPEAVTHDELARLPPHPRLLATEARWTALRAQVTRDEASRDFLAAIIEAADELVTAPPVDYTPRGKGEPIAANIGVAQRRILSLATAYKMTGETRYAKAARDVMLALVAVKWPTSHFLDVAIGCHGLALGYDWTYDALAEDERALIADKIRDAALVVSTTNESKREFLWADHNWNQVCNGGLVLGALAIAERAPGLAHRIINRAIAFLPKVAVHYAPDGIYPEGPGYWGFGTRYHVMQLEAYRSSLGRGCGLEKFPGFLESAAGLDQLTGPAGGYFNFGDSHPRRSFDATLLWFARETGRPDLAAAELARLHDSRAGGPGAASANPLALLWWQPPTTPAPNGRSPLPLCWQGDGLQPVATLRSSWDDGAATWVALKAGTSNHSHAHMDVGSFVMEARGVRWAVDPDHDDYGMIRSAGMPHAELFSYARDSRRWGIFRLGPEGHNLLRFDGAYQDSLAQATLDRIKETAAGTSVEADVSRTYAGQADEVRRRVTLLLDRSVIIADSWKTREQSAAVSWQWLTRANVTVEPGGARLEQAGETLRLRIVEGEGARVEVQDVATLVKPPYDSPNPGFSRIVIRLETPPRTQGQLTVHAIPVVR